MSHVILCNLSLIIKGRNFFEWSVDGRHKINAQLTTVKLRALSNNFLFPEETVKGQSCKLRHCFRTNDADKVDCTSKDTQLLYYAVICEREMGNIVG